MLLLHYSVRRLQLTSGYPEANSLKVVRLFTMNFPASTVSSKKIEMKKVKAFAIIILCIIANLLFSCQEEIIQPVDGNKTGQDDWEKHNT